MDLEATLLALETEGWEALSSARGADHYGAVLTDDAVMVVPGMVLSREEAVAGIRDAPPWSDFRIEEPRVVRLGADAASLTYRATASRSGQPPYVALMTTAFVRSGTSWKVALHQQTPVPEDRPPR
ncbi:MAG: hypothetical protein K0R11_474 [Acidimicrobiales bacterium]|jgi:hypothetical protein|nr:hypothetical protein [Acidimicrobiales bacterium]